MKAIFVDKNIQKIKSISFFTDAEKDMFKDIAEIQSKNEILKKEITDAKLKEAYSKYKIVK